MRKTKNASYTAELKKYKIDVQNLNFSYSNISDGHFLLNKLFMRTRQETPYMKYKYCFFRLCKYGLPILLLCLFFLSIIVILQNLPFFVQYNIDHSFFDNKGIKLVIFLIIPIDIIYCIYLFIKFLINKLK
jgi:hypothetical protein